MKITAHNLRKDFAEKTIFKDLSFEAESGQCLAVLGPNGSGKTTLLRVMANLTRPTYGDLHFLNNGEEIRSDLLYREIGFLGPYIELYQDLSAQENLDFFARIRGLDDASSRITDLMKTFGLSGREDDAVKTYSSGMKQRLKYIFALLHQPQILFVDEPRSNLDENGIGEERK